MKAANLIAFLLIVFCSSNAQNHIKIIEEGVSGFRKFTRNGLIADSRLNLYCSYSGSSINFNGLSVYNFQNATWTDFNHQNSILPNKLINNISLQNDSLLWIATDSGLYSLRNLTTMNYYSNSIYNIGNKIYRVNCKSSYVAFTSDSGIFLFRNNQFIKLNFNETTPKNFEVTSDGRLIFSSSNKVYILSQTSSYIIDRDIANQPIPTYKAIIQASGGDIYLLAEKRLDKLVGGQIYPSGFWAPHVSNFLNVIKSDLNSQNFKPNGYGCIGNCYNGFQIIGNYDSGYSDDDQFTRFYNNTLSTFKAKPFLYQTTKVLSLVNDSMVIAAEPNFPYHRNRDTIHIIHINKILDISYSVNSEMQILDINQVSAGANIGDLSRGTKDPQYEVPKGGKKHTIYASSLWIGGLDQNNSLHVSAQTYRRNGVDYSPGPLDLNTASISASQVKKYKRIWKIEAWQILEFIENFQNGNVQNGTYIPAEVILSWPGNGTGNQAQKLADFVDLNNDGLYRPLQDGDYPKIYGDQCLFWIMNDTYMHSETNGVPLGIELHCYAYAFYCPEKENTSQRAINYTTFYKYKIFNRSNNNYHDVYLGTWVDVDLGNYQDDYVGCYPSYNTAYGYNGDSFDEYIVGYGNIIPVQGTLFLNGPLAKLNDGKDNDNNGLIDEPNEKCLLNHFVFYNNSFTTEGIPELPSHYYNYLHSRYKDSTYIGNDYMYYCLPYQGCWSESFPAGDRRYLASAGPFNLNSGEMIEFDYAYVTSFDSLNTFNTEQYWQTYLNDLDVIKNHFNSANFSNPCYFKTSLNKNSITESSFKVNPNPNNGAFDIYSKNFDVISVYSIDGRFVESIWIEPGTTKVNSSNYEKGLYILKSTVSFTQQKVVIH